MLKIGNTASLVRGIAERRKKRQGEEKNHLVTVYNKKTVCFCFLLAFLLSTHNKRSHLFHHRSQSNDEERVTADLLVLLAHP